MTQAAPTGRWLTAEEAAGLLGCHPNTVYEMGKRGELRTKRIGRLLRIDPHSVFPEPTQVTQVMQPVNLQPILTQIDVTMQQLQLLRQQVEIAIERGQAT